MSEVPNYFATADAPHTDNYLREPIVAFCRRLGARRILDLGCGNGALCAVLAKEGFEVVGCDPSEYCLGLARRAHPGLDFRSCGVEDDPASLGSDFDVVISTEVVEHLGLPRLLPRFARAVLRPGGHLIVSTPYHGYLKNLAISLLGKWDNHFTALWDGGHIKFWSRTTLTWLLEGEGFAVIDFVGTGRLLYFWKSMILVARKDEDGLGHFSPHPPGEKLAGGPEGLPGVDG
jgi:2-polyprenyl-3-methyl-5-hydroxy-6-metoxy-1,4-benzoquinol methylase